MSRFIVLLMTVDAYAFYNIYFVKYIYYNIYFTNIFTISICINIYIIDSNNLSVLNLL